jgi:hypothetical protein
LTDSYRGGEKRRKGDSKSAFEEGEGDVDFHERGAG